MTLNVENINKSWVISPGVILSRLPMLQRNSPTEHLPTPTPFLPSIQNNNLSNILLSYGKREKESEFYCNRRG